MYVQTVNKTKCVLALWSQIYGRVIYKGKVPEIRNCQVCYNIWSAMYSMPLL